ncbi:MAG: hypothetical protein ACU0CO_18675, partial [Shimia sp.]
MVPTFPILAFVFGAGAGQVLGMIATRLPHTWPMAFMAGWAWVFLALVTHRYDAGNGLTYAFCADLTQHGMFLGLCAFAGIVVKAIFQQFVRQAVARGPGAPPASRRSVTPPPDGLPQASPG